jgi:hypothetical protein
LAATPAAMDRAHRIVGQHAAQVLDLGAAERLAAGHGGHRRRRVGGGDFDRLGVGAGAFRERQDNLHDAACGIATSRFTRM